MNLGLEGRRCVVTGASRGIGNRVATALAREGAHLAIVARDADRLGAVAKELQTSYERDVFAVEADLTSGDAVELAMRQASEHLGGVDILVNCAGSSAFGSFDQITDQDWMDAFSLKLLGYVRCIRSVVHGMRAQGSGRIVNVVGLAGHFATAGYTLGCFNAALLHLTRSLADDLAPSGVTVVAVNPGSTSTERIEKAMDVGAAGKGVDREAFVADYLRGIPLGRFATPEEMAEVIAFACSDVSAYMTGSSIDVDGGAIRGRF